MSPPSAPGTDRVLVIDDDPVICRLLARLLGGRYEVVTAAAGDQALEALIPGHFSVGLVDLGMRPVPGDQLARQMRQKDPDVALVLMTGWELEPDDPRRSAFDLHVCKPFRGLEEVEELVARAVALHWQRRGA